MAKQDPKDVEHIVPIIGKRERMDDGIVVDYSKTHPNESKTDENRCPVVPHSVVPQLTRKQFLRDYTIHEPRPKHRQRKEGDKGPDV